MLPFQRREPSSEALVGAAAAGSSPTNFKPLRLRVLFALAIAGVLIGTLLAGLHFATDGQNSLIDTLSILDMLGLGIVILLGARSWRLIADRDIQMKQSLADFAIAKKTAENANLAKSRYLASVSHEIRSPLNAIYGYAQLFERGDGANAQEAARVILRCSEHLTNLVEGLLDISQLECGVLRVRMEDVRLGQFIDQIVSMMRPAAYAKGLAFALDMPAWLPDVVRFDQSRFRQVLINILSNAIKFTEHGTVTLRVRYSSQIATFEVCDTGPGIAPAEQARVFEPFERHNSTEPGAGLGLAISRTLVEILGGKIELESELGQGCCFRITMMLSEVPSRLISNASVRKLIGYEGRQRKVLLVEDDPNQRKFLEELLLSLGFDVRACGNGEIALHGIEANRPDLAILDISLPGLSGWQIGTQLRERFGDGLQILMLSANSEELHRPDYANPEHDRFLVKPVEFTSLVDTVGDLLKLSWCWDDTGETPLERPSDHTPEASSGTAALDDAAYPHIIRLRDYLRIGYVRGIEAEIKQLEDVAPNARVLVDQLYVCLDRYDLAAMVRLLQEY